MVVFKTLVINDLHVKVTLRRWSLKAIGSVPCGVMLRESGVDWC